MYCCNNLATSYKYRIPHSYTRHQSQRSGLAFMWVFNLQVLLDWAFVTSGWVQFKILGQRGAVALISGEGMEPLPVQKRWGRGVKRGEKTLLTVKQKRTLIPKYERSTYRQMMLYTYFPPYLLKHTFLL